MEHIHKKINMLKGKNPLCLMRKYYSVMGYKKEDYKY